MILDKIHNSIIQHLGELYGNNVYVKRDDLIPYSFGGNKVRKAILFFEDIKSCKADCIVTYGSGSSNHCRIISNLAASEKMDCYIITASDSLKTANNSKLMNMFGAEVTYCDIKNVSKTIESKINELRNKGRHPYFIAGGGHGNIGTQAYVNCYQEIKKYETDNSMVFDYIFHASGTGTTQAGLVCGKLIDGDNCSVIGISIARKKPYGRDVVVSSVRDYLDEKCFGYNDNMLQKSVIFEDAYICGGYGIYDNRIKNTINEIFTKYSIPLDTTYTGKAFTGMKDYLQKNNIVNRNILFIHTGGLPIFFDNLGDLFK